MTSSSRMQHALFHRNVDEGHPCLVEISSRASTSLEDLQYFQNCTLHPRPEMFFVLKWLKHPSMFEDNDRNVILSKFYDLTKTGEDKFFSIEDCYKISINND